MPITRDIECAYIFLVFYRYKQGTMQHQSASSSESTKTVAESESQGSDDLQDSEVQELLDWSTSLDFNVYSIDWNAIGTSAMSEAAASKAHHVCTIIYLYFVRKRHYFVFTI